MNQHLQNILNTIKDKNLSEEEKNAILKSLKDADKELEIASFKLDRTEKVKRTTAILLEETIEELEQKRKAVEAQNRELEIESALERVRTVAMSMSKPDDMLDVCKTIALQIQSLGVKEIRNVQTAIFYEERGTYMNYEFYAKHDETFITETVYTNHEVPKDFAEQMLKGKGEVYITHIKDKEVKDWIAYQKTTNVFIDSFLENATSLNYYWHSLGSVALGISTYHPLSGEELQLFQRFLKVFDLSYRRYLDIEKAIAQAKEAKIEAALEKVRSRSLAMHKSDELNGVVTILFEKLKELQISVTAVGIAIYIEDSKDMNAYVCGENADGLVINNYRLPYFHHKISEDFNNTREKQLDFFIGNYSKEEKNSFYKYVFEHTAELRNLPDDIKTLIFESPTYTINMLAVKNALFNINDFEGKALSENEVDIIKRFARVFDQAYTRFLDLQKAEAQAEIARLNLIQIQQEKLRAENALTELQLTQKQLIQSEKMASLGELTAGIAHEIQNPLNFVNNFSEVSNELIDEMNAEIEKGDLEEAKAIASDIKQNLEKINHHGKRADAIVKGMLQHSRSSSGSKEPTDINALCDEYLRLSYHGLRAKDKSFNAILKTDYDKTIGNINIIPQDIGRVILNLITNAFYAVDEKKKKGIPGYEPTVSVSTKRSLSGEVRGEAIIKVTDNGNGIPQNIIDKIFQPFFTTKPTGQGTGLGLSLSYDIVKAHGGKLNVETKEEEGTRFTILLPFNGI